jgi:RNA polymerase sigma-70 factor (ECF subfamily)
MLSDREEAFDLTQEIFVSIHQHVGEFRADSKLLTWVFRVARNHCINRLKYLKRRGRNRSEELTEINGEALELIQGAAARPDETLEARQTREKVQRAISQLDEEQRVLVVLRDIEGLSYEEIVVITELAQGTVKSRLHRAREKLAAMLAEPEGKYETGESS